MSSSSKTNEYLLSQAVGGGESGSSTPKLRFDTSYQKSSHEFMASGNNSLIHMQNDEIAGCNSSVESVPQVSLGFEYSSTDSTHEAFRRNKDTTQNVGANTSSLEISNTKDSTNPTSVYVSPVDRDPHTLKANDSSQNSYASMSHVLVQFGRTYAVCYVPLKHRGSFGLNELVLCEAAHGEATGTSVADLTPYMDEVRTQQAQVLKDLEGDPLCPEENAEGVVHGPLYKETVTCGLPYDDYIVRLPRILRRGVNKDKKRVHFSHRRNGEALRIVQQLMRERQWESALDVAEVAYQGDFLSTTLHLHGHPDSCAWKPLEYQRAAGSLTSVLRTNIVEFRHSFACPELFHLTRSIIGHSLDDVITKFLRSDGMKKDHAPHWRFLHDKLPPPPPPLQRPHSLPAVLQTSHMNMLGVPPFNTPGLSASQMSYSSGVSSVGMQAMSNTPSYPPPRYSTDTDASRLQNSSKSSLTFPGSIAISTPGEGTELRAVVPIQPPAPALPTTSNAGYLVPLPAAAHVEIPKVQPLYYMVAPQSVPYYTSFVMPQMPTPMANASMMATPPSAMYIASPQIVGYAPPLDSHGLVSSPTPNPAYAQQAWNPIIPGDQRGTTLIPFANQIDGSVTNSEQMKRNAWGTQK